MRNPWTPIALFGTSLVAGTAKAGPPVPRPPCNGSESHSCSAPRPKDGQRVSVGAITSHCCPAGAHCNYAYVPYTECGNGACVYGRDPGRCPAPQPSVDPAKTCSTQGMEKVCLGHKVTEACVMPVPTNYTGPSPNPTYRTCGDGRCTTSSFMEDCYPTRKEAKACDGTWTKVCLGGEVSERCLPKTPPEGVRWTATEFSKCKDGSCVMGPEDACNTF